MARRESVFGKFAADVLRESPWLSTQAGVQSRYAGACYALVRQHPGGGWGYDVYDHDVYAHLARRHRASALLRSERGAKNAATRALHACARGNP